MTWYGVVTNLQIVRNAVSAKHSETRAGCIRLFRRRQVLVPSAQSPPDIWRTRSVLRAQSCPTLCDPLDYSLPDSCVHEIFQARILEWAAISFSRGSSQFRDRTRVSCTARRFFTDWATREAQKFDKHFLLMLLNLRNKFKWSLFLQKLNTFARYTEPPPCPCTLYCVFLNR